MSEEYPLYPELPEPAAQEAQALVDKFKERLRKAADEVLADLYTDVAVYIETDSWTNFRNQLLDGLKDYSNAKVHATHNFQAIRAAILREHRDEIIHDLNQDHLQRIAFLEQQLEAVRRERHF